MQMEMEDCLYDYEVIDERHAIGSAGYFWNLANGLYGYKGTLGQELR